MSFFDAIGSFFASLPHELYVFIISIFPIIELRGAIPVGAGLGLPFYINYAVAVIGNMLPIPFILLFIPKILDFLARFKTFRPIVLWLRKKADKHKGKVIKEEIDTKKRDTPPTECENGEQATASPAMAECVPIDAKASVRTMSAGVFTALLLFVAIPLPGTGAWTGALIASLFNLPKRKSFLAILLGVLVSGVIMCLASYGVVGFLKFFA